MFVNKINYFHTINILLMISLLWGCSNSNNDSDVQIRPDTVPENALWVGGHDGGVYVVIEKNISDKSTIYRAKIYHASGDLDYKGKLSINSSKSSNFKYKNIHSYSAWDGDTLYLVDGRELKIIRN
jgi:hypothetical protein